MAVSPRRRSKRERLQGQLAESLTGPGYSLAERMSAVLGSVGALVNADQANTFILPDPRSSLPATDLVTLSMDPAALDAYTCHYAQYDPCIGFGLRHPGVPHQLSDFLDPEQYRSNPHSAEHMIRFGLQWTMGVSIWLPHDLFLCIGTHRRTGVSDFGAADVALLRRLVPDLGASTFRSLVEDRVRAVPRTCSGAMGVVVVTGQGLESSVGNANSMLSDLPNPDRFASDALSSAHSDPQRFATWHLRARSGGWLRATSVAALGVARPRSATVLLESLPPGSWAFMRAELQAARLTPREQEVAIHAVGGEPLLEIAERLCISKATAKHHMSSIYTKTGAPGRAELIALLRGAQRSTREDLDHCLSRTPLTRREREVVSLAIQGLGNKEIAYRLGLSPVTVKLHLRSVYKKSKTTNRTTLASRLLARG